jgi:parallel beta-helix repeat protein
MGFSVGSGNTIRGCTANFNQGDGISITTDTFAQENTCRGNGAFGGDGGGIHVTGNNNRIEGSNVTSNTRGIQVSAAGNLIVKNSARNNGASSAGNYVIVADNRYGPIIDDTATGSIAASGKGPFASTVISTDPWANFSY